MNVLRIILSLLLVVATNVAPALAACTFSDSQAVQSACCCEEMTSYDECELTQGSCCSSSDPHDRATPATAIQTAVQPVAMPVSLVVFRNAELRIGSQFVSAETNRRPLHLASNKVYLEKRLLLI